MREHRDEIERSRHPKPEASLLVEPAEEITPLLMHHAAFKTIQILGQVLKNFTGSLKGDRKRQLVEECYGLGLRVLGSLFRISDQTYPAFLEGLTEYLKSKSKPPSEAKIKESINRLFFGLLRMVTFSVFKHVSESVGTEKVAQTFAEVVAEDKNPSVKLLDLTIRLDHYRHLPQAQIKGAAKDFASNQFAMSLMRYLVWHHFYLYPVDYKLKQEVCERLGISIEQQTRLLSPSVKKTDVKRDGSVRHNTQKKRDERKRERESKKRNRKMR